MTIQLLHQIQIAERGVAPITGFVSTPGFVPTQRVHVRELLARALRTWAGSGLRLANRIDPDYCAEYRYA